MFLIGRQMQPVNTNNLYNRTGDEPRNSTAAQGGIIVPALDEKSGDHLEVAEERARQGSVASVHYNKGEDVPTTRLVEVNYSIPMRPWKRRYALWTSNGNHVSSYEWWRHLYQPFALLFLFPAIAFAAVEWAFCLSALSVVAVSSSDLYPLPPYNFSAAVCILALECW
jgi:hypothetical protein